MGPADGPMQAALVIRDGRVVLDDGGAQRELTAIDIFRVAIRGVGEIDGRPVSPRVDVSAPGVIFHQQPAFVALLLRAVDGAAKASPVIAHGGTWTSVPLEDDHVLIGEDWYPLDPESAGAVGSWLAGHGSNAVVSAAEYIGLYRGADEPFEIIDELPPELVRDLAGGSEGATGLVADLYPYQRVGLRWLSARARAGLGGILADEMGLGKTLQVIALITQRLAEDAVGPAILILPATLLENWSRELARFAPSLRVYRHAGPHRTRRPDELRKADVVLVSYETAVIDQPVLEQVDWDLVVADEAQAIKNPDTRRAAACRAMPRHAAFAVTGTPLENRTLDTWSLTDFALPGHLGSRDSFGDQLESRPERLRRALLPLVLRREVADVAADLPERIDIDVALEMFAPESASYDGLRGEIRDARGRAPIAALLQRLRMHTAHPDCVHPPGPQPEMRSAKLTRLLEVLEESSNAGAKSIVFVAFHCAADIVVDAVHRRLGVPAWPIDGRVPVAARQGILDQYDRLRGSAVLVLNPAAAGVGLNIQAASHVVHYTLEWNPAREAQATARAWRRGQVRPVTVHRLFYADTVDELILERLTLKRELFDAVIQPTDPDGDEGLRELLDRSLGIVGTGTGTGDAPGG